MGTLQAISLFFALRGHDESLESPVHAFPNACDEQSSVSSDACSVFSIADCLPAVAEVAPISLVTASPSDPYWTAFLALDFAASSLEFLQECGKYINPRWAVRTRHLM